MTNTTKKVHAGGCHCGAVRYEAEVDPSQGTRCNCSVCTKIAGTSARVVPASLRVVAGEEHLATYAWGQKVGTRYFCKQCGVHVFGRGNLAELGGEFATVRLETLDDLDPNDVHVLHWDGRNDNWHAGARERPWPIVSSADAR